MFTLVMVMPAPYSSSVFCISSRTSIWMCSRSWVEIASNWLRPTTSRIALSATAFTVASGSSTLKRYAPASLITQPTVKLMSMMFSSPVSMSASAGMLLARGWVVSSLSAWVR